MYALMDAHVCMYECICMNVRTYMYECDYVCMYRYRFLEEVYSASRHWLFEEICRPRDIGIRGDWLTSGYWLDLILPPYGVGVCFSYARLCIYLDIRI